MLNRVLSLSLFATLSIAHFSVHAEPPAQAGETIESLSKVKASTTVNGQSGSLQDLVASGQIQLLNDQPIQPSIQVDNESIPGAVGESQVQNEPLTAQPDTNTQTPPLAELAP